MLRLAVVSSNNQYIAIDAHQDDFPVRGRVVGAVLMCSIFIELRSVYGRIESPVYGAIPPHIDAVDAVKD